MLMRAFPLVSLASSLTSSLALVASLSLVTACGRTNPDGGTDAAEIEAAAKLAAFDTEAELTALLDDDYLPAETVVLDEAAVAAIATQVTDDAISLLPFNDPATLNADLRAELDDTYLARDTALLDVTDVEDAARAACFDIESELTAVLDDEYLPIDYLPDFADLQNVPADLADGDANTVTAVTPPLELNGSTLAIDTNGCVNGEALVFQGGAFSCLTPTVPATPVSPATATAVGAAAANTRPFEALPIVIKAEFVNVTIAAANGTQDVTVYNGANPPPRALLIIDAWAVTSTVTGAPAWSLREGGANDLTTEVLLGAAGDVTRTADFNNAGQRNIAIGDTLQVRMTADADGADNATFTVYMLALPL